MSEELKELQPDIAAQTDTTPEDSSEQGLVGLLAKILQDRANQIQRIVDKFPSRVELAKELADLKRIISDYRSQL